MLTRLILEKQKKKDENLQVGEQGEKKRVSDRKSILTLIKGTSMKGTQKLIGGNPGYLYIGFKDKE